MAERLRLLLPYLFYAVGSLCFLIGTLIVIWREVSRGR